MAILRLAFFAFAVLSSARIACGQQSGVLIGVVEAAAQSESAQTFEELKEPKYKTIWLAQDATGKLAVLTTIPELIVPRKDGFWHVGVKQVCEFSHDPTDREGGNESMTQMLWHAPVGKPGVVNATQLCTEHDPGDYAPPYGRAENDMNKISQCGFQLQEIEYLSPTVISLRQYSGQSEDCEARGGRYSVDFSVITYESDGKLAVGQFLGAAANQAYKTALPAQGQGDGGEDCGEPMNRDDEWRIGRNAGRWGIYVHQNLGYFGCMVDAPVRFRLPSSVTGDNSLLPDWKLLKATMKEAEDAFVSPAKDMLIVVTKTELRFHEYADGKPGKMLLTLTTGPLVMLQWSTGTHVEEWTKQLEAIGKQPLPSPEVRIAAAKN